MRKTESGTTQGVLQLGENPVNSSIFHQGRLMPPRWPRKPDRRDPAYRRLDDRMNFAVHVGIFAASNSGLWFFRILQEQTWPWTVWVTGGWFLGLLAHAIYIFAIADYSDPASEANLELGKTTAKSPEG